MGFPVSHPTPPVLTEMAMSIPSPEPVGTYISTWGEGSLWDRDTLLYVDIEAHQIIRFNPATGEERLWNVGERVGTVVARAQDGLVYAGDRGISFLDEATGAATLIVDPEPHLPHNRFNDGKCDPAGRFWAGTMPTDVKAPKAALYCLQPDLTLEHKFGPVTVSNGIVWTKDQSTMYYIDTPRRNVLAFDYDVTTGCISNERIAIDTSQWNASPDGMTIDRDDRLWVAFCHGAAVRCFDPLTTKVEAEITLPCIEVTSCAFGGPDLGDLYITTGKAKVEEPLAGRLFVTRPGVFGVPSVPFAG